MFQHATIVILVLMYQILERFLIHFWLTWYSKYSKFLKNSEIFYLVPFSYWLSKSLVVQIEQKLEMTSMCMPYICFQCRTWWLDLQTGKISELVIMHLYRLKAVFAFKSHAKIAISRRMEGSDNGSHCRVSCMQMLVVSRVFNTLSGWFWVLEEYFFSILSSLNCCYFSYLLM